jgi:hypothetical protein
MIDQRWIAGIKDADSIGNRRKRNPNKEVSPNTRDPDKGRNRPVARVPAGADARR